MAEIALRKVLTNTLLALAKEDPRIVVLTSDATGSATLEKYVETYPDRLIDVGIAEQNEVSVAAGLSNGGLIPFICAPAAFLAYRAFEQVKLDMGYSNCNVKAVGISGGLSYGSSGMTHYAISDLANMTPVENLTVLLPSDSVQMESLIRTIAKTVGPAYVRVGRNPVPQVYPDGETFEIGKAKLVHPGSDIAVCAAGEMLSHALTAARELEREGYTVRVLDMFSVKPIDREAVLAAAQETQRLLVVEEHTVVGGIGSQIAQIVAECQPVPVKCIGLPNEHLIIGPAEEMHRHYSLTAQAIIEEIRRMLQ